MKVGDLVTRHPDNKGSRYPAWSGGIVTVTSPANDTHVKVYWPEHGALWCPVNLVEVISENKN